MREQEKHIERKSEKSYGLKKEDQEKIIHKEQHKLLHKHLDELLADFISHTRKMPSETTIFELLQWSNKQTTNPT